MKQIHFDADKIVKILLYGERKTGFQFLESKPIRNWFGIKTGKFREECWEDTSFFSGYDEMYSTEALIKLDFNVYPENKVVMRKPLVEVYSSGGLIVSQTFKTQDEAQSWVDHLKGMTGRSFNFEVLNID